MGSEPAESSAAAAGTRGELRRLPSVDTLVRDVMARHAGTPAAHRALVQAARRVIAEARAAIGRGEPLPSRKWLAERMVAVAREGARRSLRPVINATGVIVNTNLGRAPLSEDAIRAVADVARGYSNLELDLQTGERGSRQSHVRGLLRELTGAEDALVVNNNAAAVLVTLAALAAGREVVVSRGELVEIGGGFRVPDVLRQSGARLVEVGTTNRTRVADFEAAITEQTALLLAVHPSNFRVVGFTESPDLRDLARLAHERGLALVHDVGSGSLAPVERLGLAHEPRPAESVAAGADVVCFSGDKLLGGPQAGIIVGQSAPLARIARHPLMRAVRIDKLSLAALEATLRACARDPNAPDVPVWRMMSAMVDELRERAERWVAQIGSWGVAAEVAPGASTVGGGSLPGETLPTVLCAIGSADDGRARRQPSEREGALLDAAALAEKLRNGDPPVVGRVYRGQLLLDPRTVDPQDDAALLEALRLALGVHTG